MFYGHMNGKESGGHDGTESILLRKMKLSVYVTLASLINKSLETEEIPNSFNLPKVVHIYKSQNKEEFNKYRPVSSHYCTSK